jgi:hypothetical protein
MGRGFPIGSAQQSEMSLLATPADGCMWTHGRGHALS